MKIAILFAAAFTWLFILTFVQVCHTLSLNWIREALVLLGDKVFGPPKP
jgi:hypothetical protein